MSYRQKYLSKVQREAVKREAVDGYVKCISCGKIIPTSMADGGHFINRSCRATEDVPENIHAQCRNCNRFQSGNIDEYRESLVLRYGVNYVERLENLRDASRGSSVAYDKLNIEDRERVITRRTEKDYKELIRG